MAIPSWITSTIREMVPELIAEFIGVQSIKKLLNKGREKADETVKTEATTTEGAEVAKPKEPKVQHAGLFNLSDEEAYLKLIGKIDKKDATKISAFLANSLEPWQRRRFRASVGNLGEVIITPSTSSWVTVKKSETATKQPQKTDEKTAGQENRVEYDPKEIKSGGSSENIGVKFLQSFAKCTAPEMLDICNAAGIMHSDLDGVKQAWKKITDWVENQGPILVSNIDALTQRINTKAGTAPATPARPYPGFLRAFFG